MKKIGVLFSVIFLLAGTAQATEATSTDTEAFNLKGVTQLNLEPGNQWLSVSNAIAKELYNSLTVPAKSYETGDGVAYKKVGENYSCEKTIIDEFEERAPSYTCQFTIVNPAQGKLQGQ